jgi:hypothetical protein
MMPRDCDEFRALESTIRNMKRVLLRPHVRGVPLAREDRRRMLAAEQLAEIRSLLVAAIETMEAEGIDEMSVSFFERRITDLKPRVRRRGKKDRMEQFADD